MTGATTTATYQATIWIAGDIESAKQVIRERAYYDGMCVTVTPTTFIYTGGEESGVSLGICEYPRFPRPHAEILEAARHLVSVLLPALNQRTALIVATDVTEWISIEPPGAR